MLNQYVINWKYYCMSTIMKINFEKKLATVEQMNVNCTGVQNANSPRTGCGNTGLGRAMWGTRRPASAVGSGQAATTGS